MTSDNPLAETAAAMPSIEPTADTMQARMEQEEQAEISTTTPKNTLDKPEKGKRGRKPLPRDKDGNIIRTGISTSAPAVNGGALPLDPNAPSHEQKAAAQQIIAAVELSGVMLVKQAGKMEDGEKAALENNAALYLKRRGLDDIPPGVLLMAGLTMYYTKVLTAEVEVGETKLPFYAKVFLWFKFKKSEKKK